ncbi:fimbria/pilus periplasmic chaperone [Delftia tsuruhatensis]
MLEKKRHCSMLLHFLALASLLLCPIYVQASIILYGTRVIFPGDETEVTLKISNEGKRPSLAQSWLDSGNEDASPDNIDVPFVIAPSLTRLEAGDQQMLRIVYSGNPLPQDKESLFWINVLDIPPKVDSDKDSSGALALAFRTRIKLMYRPHGLSGKPQDAPTQLQWSTVTDRDGQAALQARNATPYVANLGHIALEADGKTFDAEVGPVLPGEATTFVFRNTSDGSSPRLPLPADATVVYTSLNDWGGTEGHRVELAR